MASKGMCKMEVRSVLDEGVNNEAYCVLLYGYRAYSCFGARGIGKGAPMLLATTPSGSEAVWEGNIYHTGKMCLAVTDCRVIDLSAGDIVTLAQSENLMFASLEGNQASLTFQNIGGGHRQGIEALCVLHMNNA